METKAQKAALANIMRNIQAKSSFAPGKDMFEVVEEYTLEKGALNEIYEALMKEGYYDSAAVLAKKYGL